MGGRVGPAFERANTCGSVSDFKDDSWHVLDVVKSMADASDDAAGDVVGCVCAANDGSDDAAGCGCAGGGSGWLDAACGVWIPHVKEAVSSTVLNPQPTSRSVPPTIRTML